VLAELTMTEQRYRAVLEVQAGVPVSEVAERFGVSRQAVHLDRLVLAGGAGRPVAPPAGASGSDQPGGGAPDLRDASGASTVGTAAAGLRARPGRLPGSRAVIDHDLPGAGPART